MLRKILHFIWTVAVSQINVIPPICAAMMVYSLLFGYIPSIKLCGMFIGYSLVMHMTRRYVEKAVCFLLFHVLPIALFVAVLPYSLGEKILGCFVLGAMLLLSFVLKIQKQPINAGHPTFICGTLLVTYVVVRHFTSGVDNDKVIILGSIYAVLFLMELFLRQFLSFVDMERHTNEHIPERQLFVQGSAMALGYSVVMLATLVLITNEKIADTILRTVNGGILSALRAFFRLLPRREERIPEIAEKTYLLGSEGTMPYMDPGETALIWIILEKLLMIFGGAAVIWLAVKAIMWIIRSFLRSFEEKAIQREDIVEKIVPEKHPSKEKKSGGEGLVKRIFHVATPNERVRRNMLVLREKWKRTKCEEKENTMSAREFVTNFASETEKGIAFARIYEKARYSDVSCTSAEVAQASKLVKGLNEKGASLFK